jgi:hypothetical protein
LTEGHYHYRERERERERERGLHYCSPLLFSIFFFTSSSKSTRKKKNESKINQQAAEAKIMSSSSSSSSSSTCVFHVHNPWGLLCPKKALPLPQTAVTRFPDAYICISPRARRLVRNGIQYSLLLLVLLILILWMGMEIQEFQTMRAPDTLSFYTGRQVCALSYNHNDNTAAAAAFTASGSVNGSSASTVDTKLLWAAADDDDEDNEKSVSSTSPPPLFLKIQTFASVENATSFFTSSSSFNNITNNSNSNSSSNNNNIMGHTNDTTTTTTTTTTTIIAHCGDCGQCSNPQDVAIYDATKNTLLETSIYCAKRALLWGRKTTSKCLEEMVGFTSGCNECWVENIMCDLRYCVFICFWHAIFSQLVSGEDDNAPEALNRCTLCDERRCGPQFITCAGVNRRRSGILSDIERDEQLEVCRSVQPQQWWKSEALQDMWQRDQQQQQQQQEQGQVVASSNGTTGSGVMVSGGGGGGGGDGDGDVLGEDNTADVPPPGALRNRLLLQRP